jgi:hypothetical protein
MYLADCHPLQPGHDSARPAIMPVSLSAPASRRA